MFLLFSEFLCGSRKKNFFWASVFVSRIALRNSFLSLSLTSFFPFSLRRVSYQRSVCEPLRSSMHTWAPCFEGVAYGNFSTLVFFTTTRLRTPDVPIITTCPVPNCSAPQRLSNLVTRLTFLFQADILALRSVFCTKMFWETNFIPETFCVKILCRQIHQKMNRYTSA